MSEVKQTIPGVELTSPCSCLVYWALRGLAKIIYTYKKSVSGTMNQICELFTVLTSGYLLYPNIKSLIVGSNIATIYLLQFDP